MAFSETYQALQTGVVDGTENPPSNMLTQKMHEVQKYATVTNHGYLGYAVIVNKKFWDGLPADVRTILDGAMKDATNYANKIAKQENDEDLAKIKASGKTQIYIPTAAERDAFKQGTGTGSHQDGRPYRRRPGTADLQTDRLHPELMPFLSAPRLAAAVRALFHTETPTVSQDMKFLDHLEEWLDRNFLMAA